MVHHVRPSTELFIGLLWLLASVSIVNAHSRRQPPFRRAHAPWDPSIRILGRSTTEPFAWKRALKPRASADDIQHDDTFLLNFRLGPTEDPVNIIFRPVQNLLHHDAVLVTQTGPRQRLFSHQFRAYEGDVIHDADVEQYWNQVAARVSHPSTRYASRGWARLLLRDDGAWDGAGVIDGETWHFRPTHAYEREKGILSPDTPISALARRGKLGGNTVILLSRDSMSRDEEDYELSRRGLQDLRSDSPDKACGHDALDFNLEHIHQFSFRSSLESAALARRGLQPLFSPSRLQKRQDIQGGNSSSSFTSSIGSTSGCPTEQKVLFVGVASDCTATSQFGSENEAKQSILALINNVSGIYSRTFNISVGVVEMKVMPVTCPDAATSEEPWNLACATSSSGPDLNSRLSLFSQWRADKGGGDGVGLWHLLTACNSGSEVGVAWLSQVCQVDASTSRGSTSSGTAVTALTDRSWEVIAHEQGHSFGAIVSSPYTSNFTILQCLKRLLSVQHDCDASCSSNTYTSNGVSCCPLALGNCNANSNFIMSVPCPFVFPPECFRFQSMFDRQYLCACPLFPQASFSSNCNHLIGTMFASGLNTTCIVDPGQRSTLSENACGNGIVEPGEECDPGAGSESNCCNVETCQLLPNALCDPASSGCCTSTCQYQPSDFVCRPAKDPQCDQAETCTGSGPSCPADSYTNDGTSCGASGEGLTCASGLCTSRDQQCQAQGSTLGITRACSQAINSCAITCADPRSNSDTDCVILDGTFTDGLECGLAGRCQNGECARGSIASTAKAWIERNPGIAYPVIVIGSILVLLILFYIIRCCCYRARAASRARLPPSAQYAAAQNTNGNNQQNRHSRRVSRSVPPAPAQQSRQSLYAPQPLLQPVESNSTRNSTRFSNTPRGSFNSLTGGPLMTEGTQHQPVYQPPPGPPPPPQRQSQLVVPGAPQLPPQTYRPPSMPPPPSHT